MLQLKKVKLIGVSWQCYVLGIYTINQHNKWLFSLVFVGETLWHNRYHERIVFPANLLANVLINKTKRHRKYTTQHNSINLNNRAQWTQWKQAKPDLVIYIYDVAPFGEQCTDEDPTILPAGVDTMYTHLHHCVVTGCALGLLKASARGGQVIGHPSIVNNSRSSDTWQTATNRDCSRQCGTLSLEQSSRPSSS